MPDDDHPMRIRPYVPEDLDDLYRIAVLTGDAGADASGRYEAPELLGHVFVAPYTTNAPDLAFVVADCEGIAGYAIGTHDVRDLERDLSVEWWPQLRDRYPLDAWADKPERWLVERIHEPLPTPDELVDRYPSEFHIDLLPRCQGRGLGPSLLNRVLEALREAGSIGVHCGVDERNERAIGFYKHQGFERVVTPYGTLFARAL